MWEEIYYEHYRENCRGRYWEMEEKILPYNSHQGSREKQTLESDPWQRRTVCRAGFLFEGL